VKYSKEDIDRMIENCGNSLSAVIKKTEEIARLYHGVDCECAPCRKETREGETIHGEGIEEQKNTRGYIMVQGPRGPILIEQPLATLTHLKIGDAIHKWCRTYMREKGGTYVKALEFCFEQNPEFKEAYARATE